MNGTCNYILTRMTQEGADFGEVLQAAQELGYAEPDPTFDIEGVDTAHKLAVLASLCFGTSIDFNAIHTEKDHRYLRPGLKSAMPRVRLSDQAAGHRQADR
jgi:homoserine dehydrogenase